LAKANDSADAFVKTRPDNWANSAFSQVQPMVVFVNNPPWPNISYDTIMIEKTFMEQFENDSALRLLLGSEIPNRQGDMSCHSLTKIVRGQADCLDCLEMDLKAHIYLIRQKYQKALARWKLAGCPDLGAWPDLYSDSFLVSYLRMEFILKTI
jgi:hypothetical protein